MTSINKNLRIFVVVWAISYFCFRLHAEDREKVLSCLKPIGEAREE